MQARGLLLPRPSEDAWPNCEVQATNNGDWKDTVASFKRGYNEAGAVENTAK